MKNIYAQLKKFLRKNIIYVFIFFEYIHHSAFFISLNFTSFDRAVWVISLPFCYMLQQLVGSESNEIKQELKGALRLLDSLLITIAMVPMVHDSLISCDRDVIDFTIVLSTLHGLLMLTCMHIAGRLKNERE